MNIDPYILTFSALTVFATIFMGFWSAKKSKTASDFFVAGRSVSVGWNASAISGEYLSAASFMGIAGMVMSSGYDALWYPVCYACGYLFLLLFIAGPLRRFGAYTIPDFAEGRFDSPLFRKIAVVFVLFIGFFYTMPQMKGAGTTLAYIFPGLPYWAGVVLVGAVITLNVALGGMKGITLVQAFQYWAKMFAISVPIFVLMAVYGHYGKQVGVNAQSTNQGSAIRETIRFRKLHVEHADPKAQGGIISRAKEMLGITKHDVAVTPSGGPIYANIRTWLMDYAIDAKNPVFTVYYPEGEEQLLEKVIPIAQPRRMSRAELVRFLDSCLESNGVRIIHVGNDAIKAFPALKPDYASAPLPGERAFSRAALPPKAPADSTWLNPFGPLTTKAAKNAAAAIGKKAAAAVIPSVHINNYDFIIAAEQRGDIQFRQGLTDLQAAEAANRPTPIDPKAPQAEPILPLQHRVVQAVRKMLADKRVHVSYRNANLKEVLGSASEWVGKPIFLQRGNSSDPVTFSVTNVLPSEAFAQLITFLGKRDLIAVEGQAEFVVVNRGTLEALRAEAAIGKKAAASSEALNVDLRTIFAAIQWHEFPAVSLSPVTKLPDQFSTNLSPANKLEIAAKRLAGNPVHLRIYQPFWSQPGSQTDLKIVCSALAGVGVHVFLERELNNSMVSFYATGAVTSDEAIAILSAALASKSILVLTNDPGTIRIVEAKKLSREGSEGGNDSIPSAPSLPSRDTIPLRPDITPEQHLTVALDSPTVAQALAVYAELTGRKLVPNTNSVAERVDDLLNGKLSKLKLITRGATPDSGVRFHADGMFTAGEVKAAIEEHLHTLGLTLVPVGPKGFRAGAATDGLVGTKMPSANEFSSAASQISTPGTEILPSGNGFLLVETQSSPAKTQSSPAKTQSSPAKTQSLPAKTPSSRVETPSSRVETPSLRVKTESSPAETQSLPAKIQSTPVETQSSPAKIQSTPVETQSSPAKIQSTPVETQSSPAKTPFSRVGIQPLPAETKNLPSGNQVLPTATMAEKAWLAKHEKPLALLYTYSLIIAIVCGTAGLPHILVRFYTNPDGVAAKRTTMWVMILIGVFYVFPPVFGALGRNLMPALYEGVGAKGTDKIVLELPRILNERYAPFGSILSGITCAGAFAAFMSTFSGLLVSMTGALAHDVYGRILKPKSTPEQRMRMFKIGAVIIGSVAILLGMQVEQLQINFMVGQAFAIAAASYFPLLFMAVWWRKLTMRGAAAGMLTGGLLALIGISLTSFSDLKWLNLTDFWAWHPLLRILCEQPAIWTVPLAILLMVIVSKLTAHEVPSDIRMKMLVLHAPEQLGLKQEYIQEHQHGH